MRVILLCSFILAVVYPPSRTHAAEFDALIRNAASSSFSMTMGSDLTPDVVVQLAESFFLLDDAARAGSPNKGEGGGGLLNALAAMRCERLNIGQTQCRAETWEALIERKACPKEWSMDGGGAKACFTIIMKNSAKESAKAAVRLEVQEADGQGSLCLVQGVFVEGGAYATTMAHAFQDFSKANNELGFNRIMGFMLVEAYMENQAKLAQLQRENNMLLQELKDNGVFARFFRWNYTTGFTVIALLAGGLAGVWLGRFVAMRKTH